jgi:hypothetical protein
VPDRAFGHQSCVLIALVFPQRCNVYMFGIVSFLFLVADLFTTKEVVYRAQMVALWSGELEESLRGAMWARANKLIELISDWNAEISKLESFVEELTITESVIGR